MIHLRIFLIQTFFEKLQLTTLADLLKWGIKAGVIVLD